MNIFQTRIQIQRLQLLFCLVVVTTVAAGCGQKISTPVALPVAELEPALEKAFSQAKPETRNLADGIVASLKSADYSHAYLGLQNLTAEPGLTKKQVNLLASGLLTVNQLLQSAQSQGDQQATQVLQYHRATK